MKVLVTGSREVDDYRVVEREVLASGATIVVHGGARGADSLAGRAAVQNGLEERIYPAEWNKYGKAAGPIRNQQMLDVEHKKDEPIDLVLAFPIATSIGTKDMMKRVEKAGIPMKVITYDPE